MKRIISLVVLGAIAMCVTATDRFYIEDFAILPGETRTVSILLDNEVTYTAFQGDLYLPEGLSTDEVSFDLTERKHSNHTFTVSEFPDGFYRLMSYSVKLKTFSGNNGALVTFDVTASHDFSGPVIITLRNTLFTTEEGEEIPFDVEECTVSLRCDVNCDGDVNIADVTDLIDYLLGSEFSPFNSVAADVDCDGIINIADVTALIDLLLGRN